MSVKIGYACICLDLKNKDIYSTRTLTLGSIVKKGLDEAKRLALENVRDLAKIIQHNESMGIRFFRITSNLFPHMENPKLLLGENGKGSSGDSTYNIEFAREELATVGKIARQYGHRLTMHPGQYVQIGSKDERIVEQSLRDITLHAQILAAMGMTPELGSVIIIHGGGTFGDKPAAIERFKKNFKRLDPDVRKYVALENDEFQYSIGDLLPVCEELSIPLCVDFFHHLVMNRRAAVKNTPADINVYSRDVFSRVMSTWKKRGIKPKCHWSQQREGARDGSHSDCVDEIPRAILELAHENSIDIMLEVKHKDRCVHMIYEKHFLRSVKSYKDSEGNLIQRVEWYLRDF